MAVEIVRRSDSEEGTHGTLELGDRTWHTLEQPDLGNTPYKSCVPLGEYDLVPYDSPTYGPCYVMVNHDLNVYAFEESEGRPPDGRFLCLAFHRGNWVRNFQGCIGCGFDYLVDKDMITNTRKACEIVNGLVEEEGSMKLIIRHEWE